MHVCSSFLPSLPSLAGFAGAPGIIGYQCCQLNPVMRERGNGCGHAQVPPWEAVFPWRHWTGRKSQEHCQGTRKEEGRGCSVQLHCKEQVSIDVFLFLFFNYLYNNFNYIGVFWPGFRGATNGLQVWHLN